MLTASTREDSADDLRLLADRGHDRALDRAQRDGVTAARLPRPRAEPDRGHDDRHDGQERDDRLPPPERVGREPLAQAVRAEDGGGEQPGAGQRERGTGPAVRDDPVRDRDRDRDDDGRRRQTEDRDEPGAADRTGDRRATQEREHGQDQDDRAERERPGRRDGCRQRAGDERGGVGREAEQPAHRVGGGRRARQAGVGDEQPPARQPAPDRLDERRSEQDERGYGHEQHPAATARGAQRHDAQREHAGHEQARARRRPRRRTRSMRQQRRRRTRSGSGAPTRSPGTCPVSAGAAASTDTRGVGTVGVPRTGVVEVSLVDVRPRARCAVATPDRTWSTRCTPTARARPRATHGRTT